MENNKSEKVVITNGTPNLSLLPSDILEMIAVSLELNIARTVSEDKAQGGKVSD